MPKNDTDKKAGNETVLSKEARPFNQQWINSCYQQTLLPNAPWHKLEDEISHNLAQKAEKQFSHPHRKEMLLEVLGPYFVEKYLSHVQRKPELLEHLSTDERKRLRTDAENWLNVQMYKAVRQTGHGYLLTGIGPGEPPPIGTYAAFLQETFSIFTTGLDRELYIQEKKCARTGKASLVKKGFSDIYKVPAPSRLKPVITDDSENSHLATKHQIGQPRSHTVSIEPPPLWGPQSDLMGSAVVSLLQRDPRKFEVVVGRLHGRQLPGSLRTYIWADVLFKAERQKMKEVSVEKVVRERFAMAVTRGLTELRIKKPTQSPINGLIQNAVIETYSKTTSMIPYKQMGHIKETVQALNVLYVYDRSYEPYLVHWLFPLQLAFRNKEAMLDDKGEHVLELSMYLDMLSSNCFPSWPHVFAMAEQVMMKLQQQDPELYSHLKHIAPINAQVNPKEFLIHLLHQEREKAEELLQTTSTNTPRAPTSVTQFLTDPTIFLRRWIGEGFVSILDTPGVIYVWDQIFMQNWQQSAIINVCLSLIELLRHRFMEAYDYNTMKEVFLLEPCKLYTVDFQMAWIHAESGKDLMDISDLYNRQKPQSLESRLSEDIASERESPINGLLKPCGIKNIRTHLILPLSAIHKDPWLADLKPEDLRLNVAVYFGSIKIHSRLSHSLSVTSSQTWDSYGSLNMDFEFPKERYIYDMIDISPYDVERELGAYPYAIFRVECMKPKSEQKSDLGPVTLGWSRIPLYRHTSLQDEQLFALIVGDVTVPLHPGALPESLISAQPQTPTEEGRSQASAATLLGYSCTLSAFVFDPNNEPVNRNVVPYKPKPAVLPPVPHIAARVTPPIKQPTPRQPLALPQPPPKPIQQPSPHRNTPEKSSPWTLFKSAATKSDPKPTTNRDPFVLYIDSVRYLPDSATIVKVTGRILRAGDLTNLQDILAVPDLDSPARSPVFNFSMLVNEGGQIADPELLLFLRLYTFDLETQKVVVIGSALVRVFYPGRKKGEGILNVGGHQLRLHSGMPNMKEGLNQISASDLDNNPIIPGCSFLIRLLPQMPEGILNVGGHQLRLHSGMPNMKEGLNQISASDLDNNPIIPGCSFLIRLLPQMPPGNVLASVSVRLMLKLSPDSVLKDCLLEDCVAELPFPSPSSETNEVCKADTATSHLQRGILACNQVMIQHSMYGLAEIRPRITIYVALFKTKDLIPAPDYSTGYYKSEGCKPTASELRLFASYAADNVTRPKVERDMILRLQQYEKPTRTSGSDAQLTTWLLNKLDIKKQQGANQPAGDLPLYRCVRYRIHIGLNVQIKAAFGLPDGLYIQCFARVAPGKQAKYNSPTSEGFGREEKFVTTKLSPGSHLTAPVWEEAPKKLNPFYDNNSCLIIQLFGLKVLYRPQADHKSAGTVQKHDGQSLVISQDELVGWTVVPLFEGNSVISGAHTAPVLTCPLDEEMMDTLSEKTAWQALNQAIWNNYTKIPGASIQVNVWDAHFDFHELPKVEDHQGLLEVVGDREQYLETARAHPGSITQQEFLLGMLEEKVQRQGLNGSTFKKELEFFNGAMTQTFSTLIDEYCQKNGFAPL